MYLTYMTGVIPIKIFSNQLECDKCDVVDERSVQNVHECVDNKQIQNAQNDTDATGMTQGVYLTYMTGVIP